ncbi:MAG TPA: hypothetical protein QGG47_15905 [Acidobacteriota bacterium]|nr:hypothetical protein [Acidobacteriota bacterium]
MFNSGDPFYAPILLPSDRDALADSPPLQAAVMSVTYAMNPRNTPLFELAGARVERLLVDPRTALFQFEGYLSMEDYRKVPYSPGRVTLGTLWEPRDFATRQQRAQLIGPVCDAQSALGASVVIAPYVLVTDVGHAWLPIAVDLAREALASDRRHPMAVAVCVDIDAVLTATHRQTLCDAFGQLNPELFLLIAVNFDEVEASPEEARSVVDLVTRLSAIAPVVQMYAGRAGLSAIAAGAAGYAGGGLELESHPKRYFREGLVNLHVNTYYLPGCMLRLPVRLADTVARQVPAALGADKGLPATKVHRRRLSAALAAKHAEVRALGALEGTARASWLQARLEDALEICERARSELDDGSDDPPLSSGAFHYLEVLREVAGGPAARHPEHPDF